MTTEITKDSQADFALRLQEDVDTFLDNHELGRSTAKEDLARFLGRTTRTLELWMKDPERVPLGCLFNLYNFLLKPNTREDFYKLVPEEIKLKIKSETCDRYPFVNLNDLQEDFDSEKFVENFRKDTVFQDIVLLGAMKNDYHAVSARVVEKKFGTNGKKTLDQMLKEGFIYKDAANYLSLPKEVEIILSEFKGTCLLDEALNSRYKISDEENISEVNHGLLHTFFTGLNRDAIREVQKMEKEYLNKAMSFLSRSDTQGSIPYFFTLNSRYDNIALSSKDDKGQ